MRHSTTAVWRRGNICITPRRLNNTAYVVAVILLLAGSPRYVRDVTLFYCVENHPLQAQHLPLPLVRSVWNKVARFGIRHPLGVMLTLHQIFSPPNLLLKFDYLIFQAFLPDLELLCLCLPYRFLYSFHFGFVLCRPASLLFQFFDPTH